jgi:hypothetical protein
MSRVIHKTTKQIIENASCFEPTEGVIRFDDTDDWAINPDTSAVDGTSTAFWKYDAPTNCFTPTEGAERTDADAIALEAAKEAKIEQIEARTQWLLNNYGYEFPPGSGQRFSLSVQTCIMLNGLIIAKDVAPYPVRWNTIDQKSVFEIPSAEVVGQFYMTAFGTYKALQDSGTDLKNAIRACTSIQQVVAIKDPR